MGCTWECCWETFRGFSGLTFTRKLRDVLSKSLGQLKKDGGEGWIDREENSMDRLIVRDGEKRGEGKRGKKGFIGTNKNSEPERERAI